MLRSTPIRALFVVVLLAGSAAGYRWWNSPERQIRSVFGDVASALTHDGADTDLQALSALTALQSHLTVDVSIDAGPRFGSVSGRQDVVALAARFRASTPFLRVQFFDAEVTLSSEATATSRVTAQVTVRDRSGEDVADAHDLLVELARSEGRWQVRHARMLPDEVPR